MIVSVWCESAKLYRYYQLEGGHIRIEIPCPRRGLRAFTDVVLHAEGEAYPAGQGDEPKGAIVHTVEVANEGWDVSDFFAAYAGVSLTRYALNRGAREGIGWEEVAAGVSTLALWNWFDKR